VHGPWFFDFPSASLTLNRIDIQTVIADSIKKFSWSNRIKYPLFILNVVLKWCKPAERTADPVNQFSRHEIIKLPG
jgi:hypothetical protein